MKNRSTIVKILIKRWALVIAALILLTAGVIKWQSNLMPTNTFVPTNPLPAINAKDMFAIAVSEMDDKDAGNIAPWGATASNFISLKNPVGVYAKLTPAQIDSILAKNHKAIITLKSALKYPYMDDSAHSFNTLFTWFGPDRAMARLLRVDAENKVAHHDLSGAMDDYLAGIQMGCDIKRGSVLIGMLVGVACEAIERRDMYALINRLNAGQAKAAARRLVLIDSINPPPFQTLQEEEWLSQGGLLQLFREERHWRGALLSDSGNSSNGQGEDFITILRFATESPRNAYNSYTNYMNQVIAIAKLPWPQQIKAHQPPIPNDPMSGILLPIFADGIYRSYLSTVMNRILEAQLALQAYKVDHKAYPASLDQLVPHYLSSVPLDPFTENQPLKYKPVGSKYLLYSIGPDDIDNGGKPIYNPSADKGRPYLLQNPQDKGDVVAGINQQ